MTEIAGRMGGGGLHLQFLVVGYLLKQLTFVPSGHAHEQFQHCTFDLLDY